MRLTLRTLIAYLDDILDPAETKEIGQKISESEVAQQLVNRVKEVLRRRRLTAPTMHSDHANMDANRMAEYLDNTLTPADVAEVEKICLESDMHLAESAACHQILTLVLGEPVDIIPESREKMYSLGPKAVVQSETEVGNADNEPRIAPATREKTGNSGKVELSAKTFPKPIPQNSASPQAPRKSLVKRAMPFLFVLLLLGTFVGLIVTDDAFKNTFSWALPWSDQPKSANEQIASTDSQPGSLKDKNNEVVAPIGSKTEIDANDVSNNSTAKNKKDTNANKTNPMPKLPDDIDPPPPVIAAKKDNSSKPIVENNPPNPKNRKVAKTGAAKTTTSNPTKNKAKPVVIPPVVKPVIPVQFLYADKTGVRKLWKFDKTQRDYLHFPPDSIVHEFDKFIVPESFGTEITSDTGVAISISGSSSFTILPSDDRSLWGLDLKQGRLRIRRDSALAINPDPSLKVSMAMLIGGKLYYLQLLTPNSEFGIEVVPSPANGFEKDLGEDIFSGAVYSVIGKVKITDFAGEQWVLEAGTNRKDWLPLTPSARKEFAKPGSAIPKLVVLPDWLTRNIATSKTRTDKPLRPVGIQPTQTKAELAALKIKEDTKYFRNEFEVDRTLTENLLAISRDRRSKVAALAVKSLTLTNNHQELIELLAKAQHKQARLEAYLGLRRWIPEDMRNTDLLKEELKIYYSSNAVDRLMRLIWGIDQANLKNPRDSEDIVDWLNDSELIVRELTFHQLSELTDLRYGYRPDSSVSQRSRTVARWRNHLKRHGMLAVNKKKDVGSAKKKSDKQDSRKGK